MKNKKCLLDIREIQKFLPHRYPFLLVDRILEIEEGKRIVGLKNVTFNEPFFQGHFPQAPVMPGVLIIEAMAQVGGVLAYKSAPPEAQGKLIYFGAIDKVRFRKPVIPGDQIIFKLEMLRQGKKVCKMRGEALVDGEVVAEGELTAMLAE
ncbi:MAG: 3-hydroxyacyl-ACP dehydratase FabZ [Candidatus Desulfofervidaceae bacterium]|nr:3-hydroxyacyl-ACP dehydratase FabZ [Candidatus Desulfofervidaceae bacterium]